MNLFHIQQGKYNSKNEVEFRKLRLRLATLYFGKWKYFTLSQNASHALIKWSKDHLEIVSICKEASRQVSRYPKNSNIGSKVVSSPQLFGYGEMESDFSQVTGLDIQLFWKKIHSMVFSCEPLWTLSEQLVVTRNLFKINSNNKKAREWRHWHYWYHIMLFFELIYSCYIDQAPYCRLWTLQNGC